MTFRNLGYMFIIVCLIASCKKNADDSGANTNIVTTPVAPPFTGPNVYVVGYQNVNSTLNAIIWKNGTPTTLSQIYSVASGIAVQGNDVYVAGTVTLNTGVPMAVYWKNGEQITLGEGNAKSVLLQGDDVYVAGYSITHYSNDNNIYRTACYWKNGVLVTLTFPLGLSGLSGVTSYFANAIAVQGNDVYVIGSISTGTSSGYGVAAYWKNGIGHTLIQYFAGNGNLNAESNANAISIVGRDVYIAGDIGIYDGTLAMQNTITGPVYWKNDVAVALTNNDVSYTATGIAIDGTDIYVSGSRGPVNFYNSVYWKNNIAKPLDIIRSFNGNIAKNVTVGILVYNSDIYVVGNAKFGDANYPTYWKNGISVPVSIYSGTATGIAVAPL